MFVENKKIVQSVARSEISFTFSDNCRIDNY